MPFAAAAPKKPQSGPPVFSAPPAAAPVARFGGSAPAGGAAAAPTGPFGAGGVPNATNTAQNNPEVSAWLKKVSGEFDAAPKGGADPFLEESIGNLRTRLSTDNTERATQRAERRIMDQAAGARALNAGSAGRRGFDAKSGALAKLDQRTNDAAQRAAAGATADIELGRQRDLDSLTLAGHNILSSPSQLELARRGQSQNLLGMGMGGANTLAQIGLADRSLNLQQWQTIMADQRARAEMAAAEQARREGQMLALKEMDMRAASMGLAPSGGGVSGGFGGNTRGAVRRVA